MQALVVVIPVGLIALALAILFEALFGDEFGLYEGGDKWDWTFVLVAIYLGVLGGYWLGAMNGWEAGERHGREHEHEEAPK